MTEKEIVVPVNEDEMKIQMRLAGEYSEASRMLRQALVITDAFHAVSRGDLLTLNKGEHLLSLRRYLRTLLAEVEAEVDRREIDIDDDTVAANDYLTAALAEQVKARLARILSGKEPDDEPLTGLYL